MLLSSDGSILMKVSDFDIQNGLFIIPQSVTIIDTWAFNHCKRLIQINIPDSVTEIHCEAFKDCSSLVHVTIPSSIQKIDKWVFWKCTSLNQVILPHSVTSIGVGAFANCNNLKVIAIDSLNQADHDRICTLMPQEFQTLILSQEVWKLVKQARVQVLESMIAIGVDWFPRKFPEEIIKLIQQMDERLHDVICQVPLPYSLKTLSNYQQDLQQVLCQIRQEQDYLSRRLVAIYKLQKVIQINKEILTTIHHKNPGFFETRLKQFEIDETNVRITVAIKLIAWLQEDKTISFSQEEKAWLNKPQQSIAMILKNQGICIEEWLPLSLNQDACHLNAS